MTRPVKRERASHVTTSAEARRHPGVWVRLGSYRTRHSARVLANQIKTASGNYYAYAPAGPFDARTQDVDAETEVAVRYLGPVGGAS